MNGQPSDLVRDFTLPVPKEVLIAPNEKILMVLGRSYMSFVTLVTIGLIVLWVAVATINLYLPSEHMWIMFPLIVFCFFLLPLLLYGLGYIYVKGHCYIITNERTIMFRKFIGILLRTVTYDKITDLIVNQGPIGRLCNYGRNWLNIGLTVVTLIPMATFNRFE